MITPEVTACEISTEGRAPRLVRIAWNFVLASVVIVSPIIVLLLIRIQQFGIQQFDVRVDIEWPTLVILPFWPIIAYAFYIHFKGKFRECEWSVDARGVRCVTKRGTTSFTAWKEIHRITKSLKWIAFQDRDGKTCELIPLDVLSQVEVALITTAIEKHALNNSEIRNVSHGTTKSRKWATIFCRYMDIVGLFGLPVLLFYFVVCIAYKLLWHH